eukprot:5268936-Pyramimonas_sp.AAC.1
MGEYAKHLHPGQSGLPGISRPWRRSARASQAGPRGGSQIFQCSRRARETKRLGTGAGPSILRHAGTA